MKAIRFEKDISKLITVTYGETDLVKRDEFWVDFTPNGGEKTLCFRANLVLDNEHNRNVVLELVKNAAEQKAVNDVFEQHFYRILNKLKR